METSRRFYRDKLRQKGLISFTVSVKETDLWIAVDSDSYQLRLQPAVEQLIYRSRRLLESYIERDPDFARSLEPYTVGPDAPPLVLKMVRAANKAGVGPMAAVAGCLAELAGNYLLRETREVIVENGGDIFLKLNTPRRIAVFAGNSPFSGRLALRLRAGKPYSVCTSSGTVGPSFSFGKCDAAVIISPSAALADAVATASGNLVRTAADLPRAIAFCRTLPGISGALLIIGDKMSAWGDVALERL